MSKSPAHQTCSICRTIPDESYTSWKGEDFMGGDLPRSEEKLEVVGAPFFDDRTSYSHTCLKQCPECHTYYEWRFQYELLIGGSEDDIELTRLSDKEGDKRAKNIFAAIRAAEEKFILEAQSRLETLLTAEQLKGVYGAAYFLETGQMKGHDITFALPALVRALVRFAGTEGADGTEGLLYLVISQAIEDSADAATAVLQLLAQHNADASIPRIGFIKTKCEKVIPANDQTH